MARLGESLGGQTAPQSARQLGHDDCVGVAESTGVLLGWPGLIDLDERQQQLGCTRFARGRAVHQLLDGRLELGDAASAPVLVDRDLLAQSRGDDRAEVARALGRPRGLLDWPGQSTSPPAADDSLRAHSQRLAADPAVRLFSGSWRGLPARLDFAPRRRHGAKAFALADVQQPVLELGQHSLIGRLDVFGQPLRLDPGFKHLQQGKRQLDRFLSPRAASLASWVTTALSLVMRLRRPFSAMVTDWLMAAMKTVAKFRLPLPRPLGLPDWPLRKRVWTGGLP